MIMVTAMRGVRRSLCVVLGLLLLSAACNAKKLWGVDVGKKEERGEFASLLQQASGEDRVSPGEIMADQIGSFLSSLETVDLSQFSLGELCTSMIDMALEVVKDEQFVGQFAEPGVIGEMALAPSAAAFLTDDSVESPMKDAILELLSLESSPVLYKTKVYEMAEQAAAFLVSLRMDVADPVKLNEMIKYFFRTFGADEEFIAQIMEVVTNPEVLAAEVKKLLVNPATMQQIQQGIEGFTTGMDASQDLDEDQLMEMLAALEQDPEMMEQMLALMKDPAFAESLMEDEKEAGAGGFFKGAGGRPGAGQRVEL
ncbi:unnamed protein product [Pylaiella littoralis]